MIFIKNLQILIFVAYEVKHQSSDPLAGDSIPFICYHVSEIISIIKKMKIHYFLFNDKKKKN